MTSGIRWKKWGIRIGAVSCLAVLLLSLGVASLATVVDLQPHLEAQLSQTLGRPVIIGAVRTSLFSEDLVQIHGLHIPHPDRQNGSPLLLVERASLDVKYKDLFADQIKVHKVHLKSPVIALDTSWSSTAGGGSEQPQMATATPTIESVTITNGTLVLPKGTTKHLRKLKVSNVHLQNLFGAGDMLVEGDGSLNGLPFSLKAVQRAAEYKPGEGDLLRLAGSFFLNNHSSDLAVALRRIKGVSQLDLTLNAHEVSFDSLFALANSKPSISGAGSVSAELHSEGSSMPEFMKRLTGGFKFISESGVMRNGAITAGTGSISKALGGIFGKSEDARMHCLHLDFEFKDGYARSKSFVTQVEDVTFFGDTSFNLLDFNVNSRIFSTSHSVTLGSMLPAFVVEGPLWALRADVDSNATGYELLDSGEALLENVGDTIGGLFGGRRERRHADYTCARALQVATRIHTRIRGNQRAFSNVRRGADQAGNWFGRQLEGVGSTLGSLF